MKNFMHNLYSLGISISPKQIGVDNPVTNADSAVSGALTTVYLVAGIIAVLVIIGAGYLYTTSGGNAAQVKRSKDAIVGAVVGLVVVIMAFIVTQYVIGKF